MAKYLAFASLLNLCLANNNSYFSIPELSYSTPSGRPGNDNRNKVYFNVTDVQHGGTADCHYFWPLADAGPNVTHPAVCNDTSFSWHFGSDPVISNFDITIKHEGRRHRRVQGQSPRYVVGTTPGATFECGGSGACFFWVGSEDEPLKIYFD